MTDRLPRAVLAPLLLCAALVSCTPGDDRVEGDAARPAETPASSASAEASAGPAPPADGAAAPTEAELARARAAADGLTKELGGRLQQVMAAEGPAAAARVCAEEAQARTAAHALEGLAVRRVSDRLRNPANAPDAVEGRELAKLHALHGEGRLPTEVAFVSEGGDEVRYLRPIVTAPLCLSCHGAPESIPPEVRALLDEKYPDDRATGYGEGELRGLVSVRVPRESGLPGA